MSRVIISETQRGLIFAQLEAAYPDEGAGFLLGQPLAGHADADVVIAEVIAAENVSAAEERHHRFVVKPSDWMRLEDEADSRGLSLVGCYHSHPDSPPLPSAFDREHSLPNFVYIIASVLEGSADEMRCWALRRDSQSEHVTAVVDDHQWQAIMQRALDRQS